MGSSINRGPGGKGANQAVAAARLGSTAVLIAAVGDDADGTYLVDAAAAQNVNTGHIRRETAGATGTAMITLDDAAENFIVVSPGANALLTPDEVRTALLKVGQEVCWG